MVDLAKLRKKGTKAPVEPAPEPPAESPSLPAAELPREVVETKPAQEVPERRRVEEPKNPAEAAPSLVPEETAHGPSKLDKFKAEAGKRRDAEVAKVDAGVETLLELLTFVIAGEHYAVDIERIVEIVTPRNVTRIPNADASVVGILSLRGTIVTLVDVRRKLRHRVGSESTPDTRIVVVDFNNEIVGFLVDRVLRVVKASPEAIEPHPVVHTTELDQAVRGVFRVGDALTILLDLDKLLDHGALAARSA
jgi:purine-binding chemotaxis protein CheW